MTVSNGRLLLFAVILPLATVATFLIADEPTDSTIEVMDEAPAQPEKSIEKSEEEWRDELTAEQFRILREAGTERAGGPVYDEFKKQGAGTYYCAGCGAELFSAKQKFDAHCGWPSFYDPSDAKNVTYETDFKLGYARKEVRCKVCDGHLGHVFEGEGYDTPTDKRYCINGTVLKFVPAGGEKGEDTSEADGAERDEAEADSANAPESGGAANSKSD